MNMLRTYVTDYLKNKKAGIDCPLFYDIEKNMNIILIDYLVDLPVVFAGRIFVESDYISYALY